MQDAAKLPDEAPATVTRGRVKPARTRGSIFEGSFVLVALLALIVLGTYGQNWPGLHAIENLFDDVRVGVFIEPEPVHPKITIVKIDEDTTDFMRQRSPIDRAFLVKLLTALNDAKPAAIAIDILFDEHTDPDADEALRRQLASMQVPVVIASGSAADDADKVTAKQQEWADRYFASIGNPLVTRGHPRLPQPDADGVVRLLPEAHRTQAGGGVIPSLTTGAIEAAGWIAAPVTGRIAWYGGTSRFTELPAQVLNADSPGWKLLKPRLAGKIIFVGTFLMLDDLHKVPQSLIWDVRARGVEIQANVAAQLLDGRWVETPPAFVLVVLAGISVALGFTIGAWSHSDWLALSLLLGTVLVVTAFSTCIYLVPLDGGHGRLMFPIASPSLAVSLATALGYAMTRRKFRGERNFVRNALGKYVSPSVAKELIDHPELLAVGGDRRVVTIIFTDIAGFTTLSESLEPDVLANVLNRYLGGMSKIVLAHDGTIDKYIGDAVVAIWGAPLPQPDHAARAIGCAIDMARFAATFAAEQLHDGIKFGRTRIGIQTGPAIVGNFGGEDRLNYTAIGDTVNSASRFEGANKYLGTSILIGAPAALSSGRSDLRPVADLVVKGKEDAVAVFTPEPDWSEEQLTRYRLAYRLLETDEPSAAEALRRVPVLNDAVIELHLDRLAQGQRGARIVLDDK